MTIRAVNEQTLSIWATFASQVWQTKEQVLIEEFSNNEFPFEFLYYSQSEEPIAWISLSLRHDYVEGCQFSPVAYVEGIFVHPDYRGQGIAAELLDFADSWAKSHGARELASDTDFENSHSQAFHTKNGFREVSRNIHYVRKVEVE